MIVKGIYVGRTSLVDELIDYTTKQKAERIYKKCIKNGKLSIAKRIKMKYGVTIGDHNDMIDAMRFSYQYFNSIKK
jgi:hypothetical protein